MDFTALIAIFIAVILIGFFAGVEIAFVSANKLSLELNKKQGTYAGKIWGNFAENPIKFISTILIISNVLLVIYGLLIGTFLLPLWQMIEKWLISKSTSLVKYLHFIKLFVEIFVATVIILFVEFFCKSLFKARNNNLLANGIITYLAQFFYTIFAPVATMFINVAEWILEYIFNIKVPNKKEGFAKVDVDHFMQQNNFHTEEDNGEINKELFENALSLRDVRLRECLVPRKEIVGISKESSIEDLKKLFIESRLSKLVVFDKNIDTIIGYIHQLDLFKSPALISDILLPIPTVPETMSATDLMARFSKDRKSIAWVIDEFGGTAGIVTMEDLLEEIFGEIKDEYDDVEEFIDKQISETEYLFSGRVELDLITEKYGLDFPEDETAETLSGFIIQHNEDIPKEKEQIIVGNYEFSIMSMSDTRIETVKLKVLRNK
jgi:putative hemolysin